MDENFANSYIMYTCRHNEGSFEVSDILPGIIEFIFIYMYFMKPSSILGKTFWNSEWNNLISDLGILLCSLIDIEYKYKILILCTVILWIGVKVS